MQAAIDVLLRLPGHLGLHGVQLDHAHLPHARLGEPDLSGAQLNLAGARLDWANLAGAWLSGPGKVVVTRVALSGLGGGADLSTAKGLIQQQLDSARGDDHTKLPAGLQRPVHWLANLQETTGCLDRSGCGATMLAVGDQPQRTDGGALS